MASNYILNAMEPKYVNKFLFCYLRHQQVGSMRMVLTTGTFVTWSMIPADDKQSDAGASERIDPRTDPARGVGFRAAESLSLSRSQAPLASELSGGKQLRQATSAPSNSNMQAELRPPHRRCRVFEQYEAPLPVGSSPRENYHFRAHLINQQVVLFHPEHIRRIHSQAS